MSLHGFLRTRCSIRRFQAEQVPGETINRIIETAMYAPSAHNRQPWRFAVITRDEIKVHLAQCLSNVFRRDLEADGIEQTEIDKRINRSTERIELAPVIIILSMDMSEMDIYQDRLGRRQLAERTMAIQSVATAGLQLQLAAHAEGLGSVWTCSPLFAPETVCVALDLPPSWEPQAMFFLGHAAASPKEKNLKPLAEIVKYF